MYLEADIYLVYNIQPWASVLSSYPEEICKILGDHNLVQWME